MCAACHDSMIWSISAGVSIISGKNANTWDCATICWLTDHEIRVWVRFDNLRIIQIIYQDPVYLVFNTRQYVLLQLVRNLVHSFNNKMKPEETRSQTKLCKNASWVLEHRKTTKITGNFIPSLQSTLFNWLSICYTLKSRLQGQIFRRVGPWSPFGHKWLSGSADKSRGTKAWVVSKPRFESLRGERLQPAKVK